MNTNQELKNLNKHCAKHLGLEGVTEVDTHPKERFVSFKVTASNESSLMCSFRE